MFLSRNKRNNVYPCKPQFYYIKVGFKGVNIRHVFVMSVCASVQPDKSLPCPHQETLHRWLSKLHPVKILNRLEFYANCLIGDNMHEMSKPIFWENNVLDKQAKPIFLKECEKIYMYLKILSVESFT